MLIRTLQTYLLQIFRKINQQFQIIAKSMKGLDDNF